MPSVVCAPVYMMSGVAVIQPTHLEGDPSLATEILPGPPSFLSASLSTMKRDPRKPNAVLSYLPASDPGSTYSGPMNGHEILEGPRVKRARVDKGGPAKGRRQRSSGYHLNGAQSALDLATLEEPTANLPQQTMGDSDLDTVVVDDIPLITHSNYGLIGKGKVTRRDKGKGREIEPPMRIKEEPSQVSLSLGSPEPLSLVNEDYCSACRSQGALVYCDGCPRAFHFWCLDPPLELADLPESDNRWFCPSCMIRRHPPQKPPSSILSPLIDYLQNSVPTEFQLPDDVRAFFKDVAIGPRGTYIDGIAIKQPRLNRHGQLEDRDANRLRDRNGAPILCFQCGMSALPGSVAASAPAAKRAQQLSKDMTLEAWKSIISCDYCNLHWHLDCLDPPLQNMPSFNKKWMCPNHVDQVLHPKRRIPKQNAPPIEITKRKTYNNGNIEIIDPQTASTVQPKVAVDEVLINGRRYRVPERVILLDFWDKVRETPHYNGRASEPASAASSPLTSLSSLDDLDDGAPPLSLHEADDLKIAELLCMLKHPAVINPAPRPLIHPAVREMIDTSVQTEATGVSLKPSTNGVSAKRASKKVVSLNGRPSVIESNSTHARPLSTSWRRHKPDVAVQAEGSSRELRSRSKNMDSSVTSVSSKDSSKRTDEAGRDGVILNVSVSTPSLRPHSTSSRLKVTHIKVEDSESSYMNVSSVGAGSSSRSTQQPPHTSPAKRTRTIHRPSRNEPQEHGKEDNDRAAKRRREIHDEDEGGGLARVQEIELAIKTRGEEKGPKDISRKEKRATEKKKSLHTSARQNRFAPPPSVVTPSPSAPTTPSLKIRLPAIKLNTSTTAASVGW